MVIFGTSNIGMIRKENQDSYLFDTADENIGLAVVCDGMGGASGGKTASSMAVNIFSSSLSCLKQEMSEEEIIQLISEAVRNANIEIFNKSVEDETLSGMGTTLVSAINIDSKCYFTNIGDSRAYLIRDGVIKRVTKDHSAVQQLVDEGVITESQARNHPNKNIITRALGVSCFVEFDLYIEQLQKNDVILLCSDGVTNYIDDLEIPFEIFKHQNIESVPQKLIELANARGGADNSTVVIFKI